MNSPDSPLPSLATGRTITLASGSAPRLRLLRAAGVEVQARPADLDEAALKRTGQARGDGADAVALALAAAKAGASGEAGWVIGADQLLVCEGAWFDKPADLGEARRHLERLRGRAHVLHTAVVLAHGGRVVWRHVAHPRLVMRAVSDGFVDAYLAAEGEALLASVGAYRLEGLGLQLFSAVRGEHGAILGLPMLPLLGALRQRGLLAV